MKYVDTRGLAVAAVLVCIFLVGTFSHAKLVDSNKLADIPLESIPKTLGDWETIADSELDFRSKEILKLDRYIKRTYQHTSGTRAILYIGYWRQQTGDTQAAKHSPAVCLPANGWSVSGNNAIPMEVESSKGTSNLSVKRLTASFRERPYAFYYWFFSGESEYNNEWAAIFLNVYKKLTTGKSDGGIVEISIPIDDNVPAEKVGPEEKKLIDSFVKELYPALIRVSIDEAGVAE
jgi:EpsI family protein